MGHWRKSMITFMLTTECNLSCGYCYSPKLNSTVLETDKVIDIDFAKAGLEDYFSNTDSRAIRFFSAGEPTMAFDHLVKITELARKIGGDKVTVELQTNGFFGADVRDWIAENVNSVWISCDGPPEIHKRQRPKNRRGSFLSDQTIYDNISFFTKERSDIIGVRTTVLEQNFHRQSEFVRFFIDMGVTKICGAPAYSSTVNRNTSVPPLLAFSEHFVPAFHVARELGGFYLTHLIVNFDEKSNIYCRSCLPDPHLTPDGFVSCCDWALLGPKYLGGVLQKLVYGHYNKTTKKIVYNTSKIIELRSRNADNLSQETCKGCDVLYNCAGGCIGKNIVLTDNLFTPDSGWCDAVRYLAKNLPMNQGPFPFFHS